VSDERVAPSLHYLLCSAGDAVDDGKQLGLREVWAYLVNQVANTTESLTEGLEEARDQIDSVIEGSAQKSPIEPSMVVPELEVDDTGPIAQLWDWLLNQGRRLGHAAAYEAMDERRDELTDEWAEAEEEYQNWDEDEDGEYGDPPQPDAVNGMIWAMNAVANHFGVDVEQLAPEPGIAA
jgi:hypothetical protein